MDPVLTLTTDAKAIVLKALFGSTCSVGLTRNGKEISDSGYQRQPITFSDPETNGETVSTTNVDEAIFGPWEFDAPAPVTGWLIARDGQVLGSQVFSEPRERPRKGDEQVIRAGALRLVHP